MKKLVYCLLVFLAIQYNGFCKINNSTKLPQFVQLTTKGILSEAHYASLAKAGFQHIEYIADTTYFATYTSANKHLALEACPFITSIDSQSIDYKCAADLKNNSLPAWATFNGPAVKINIEWQSHIEVALAEQYLLEACNIACLPTHEVSMHHSQAYVLVGNIAQILPLAYVRYVSVALPKDKILNGTSRAVVGDGYAANAPINSGRGLTGEGLVVGLGDNADPQYHVDLVDRLINFNSAGFNQDHGFHTMGTLGGGW